MLRTSLLVMCMRIGISGFPRSHGNRNVARNGNGMGMGINAIGVSVAFLQRRSISVTLFPVLISASMHDNGNHNVIPAHFLSISSSAMF